LRRRILEKELANFTQQNDFQKLPEGRNSNLEVNEHAYTVFSKNMNSSPHVGEQKRILLRIKSAPDTSFPLV
jgi:hypothetical protein